MMKRFFSVAVALFLLVGCASNSATTASSVSSSTAAQSSSTIDSASSEDVTEEASENTMSEPEYSNDFNHSTNLTDQMGEVSYEIPVKWSKTDGSSNTSNYYRTSGNDGMFAVSKSANDDPNIDMHSKSVQDTLIPVFTGVGENVKDVSTENTTIAGYKAIFIKFKGDIGNQKNTKARYVVFCTPLNMYSVMIYDLTDDEIYQKDYEQILKTVSVEEDDGTLEDVSYDEPFWTYSGEGDDVVTGLTTENVYTIMKITHLGGRHFDVKAHYDNTYDLLVNQSDPYDGGLTLLEPGKTFTFEVSGTGPWTLEAYHMGSSSTDTFEATGDYVSPLFIPTSTVYEIETHGSRHIDIKAYYATGRYELLVNTSDPDYSGKVMFNHPGVPCFFAIKSSRQVTIRPAE